jgi:signal transduction histidine kinase
MNLSHPPKSSSASLNNALLSADILVVDDVPDNIRLLSTILTEQGYKVRKAINGQMALTAAQTTPPDLILLDVNMPKMNGYEVCQQLKSAPETMNIPVIFLSALDHVSDKVSAFEVGGADYVTKPFQVEEVLARVQHQLQIRNLQAKLQNRNLELQHTLSTLRTTQAQLIQQEKLAGLGQIVAGIAHEFNNPANFISGNLSPALKYVQELVTLVDLYQREYPNPSPAIQQAIEEIDLKFLLPDLRKLTNSMQRGVDRIRSIVLALRIFSHLDESEIKAIDLHRNIDSTLLLLQYRLRSTEDRPEIQVIKQYSILPPLTCYASQLNQVFFNLLDNAIDALETCLQAAPSLEQPTNQATHQFIDQATVPPTIWIRTQRTPEGTIVITIEDNGCGMTETVQTHLYEPFFTTKPVGQGAGLGLSTSYQVIVEKHQGQITCHSILGEGTRFTIELPLQAAIFLQPSSALST